MREGLEDIFTQLFSVLDDFFGTTAWAGKRPKGDSGTSVLGRKKPTGFRDDNQGSGHGRSPYSGYRSKDSCLPHGRLPNDKSHVFLRNAPGRFSQKLINNPGVKELAIYLSTLT